MEQDMRREVAEAIRAADVALTHLSAAESNLQSAGNWGVWDLLGGGFLSTLIKHGKMDQAEEELSSARDALRRFAKELRDVEAELPLNVRVDDFLGFADYFFDGLVADWLVQKRIREASAQVTEAIRRVREIRARLTALPQ